MKMFSVYDRAIEAHTGQPFFQPTGQAAIRVITDEAKREGSNLQAHPTDYELWEIGTFDETSGQFTPNLQRIARVEDLA